MTKDEEIRHNAVVQELTNSVATATLRGSSLAAELASTQAALAQAMSELEELKKPKDTPKDGSANPE